MNMNIRNKKMVMLKQQGSSYAEIAAIHGISRQRVFQIVKRDKGKLTPEVTRNPLKQFSEALERGLKRFFVGLLGRIRK